MILNASITYVDDDTLVMKLNHKIKKEELKLDVPYMIKLENEKEKRTLAQNRYIWEIISQIDKKINGYASDEMSIYKQIIQQAKIKSEYIIALPDIKKRLEKVFRFVEEIEDRLSEKGVAMVVFRCYYGTSKFDKKEMKDFIEALIDRAYEEGIDVCGYESMLRN